MKIGWIDFLNTVPFDFRLIGIKLDFPYELSKGFPSEINKKLREKEVDIGFISSAEYIENYKKYIILPDVSISSLNKVQSVAIFSNIPIEKMDKVYLTRASKTSRMLTKIIFKDFLKKNVQFLELEDFTDIEKKSVLLIGDNAIRYKNKFSYVYDLSAIWYQKTGLPFVFALWCVNEDFYKKNREDVESFHRLLLKTKNSFFENPLEYLRKSEKAKDIDFAYQYLKNLDYCLSEEHLKSLNLFAEKLIEIGLIKEKPEFRFIK